MKIEVVPIIEDSEFIPEDRSLPARLPSRAVEQQAEFTAVNIPGEDNKFVASNNHLYPTGKVDNCSSVT